jgi:hypothetical protein
MEQDKQTKIDTLNTYPSETKKVKKGQYFVYLIIITTG